jgi:hypothetical protein
MKTRVSTAARPIQLVIADVDGTLLTQDKKLASSAIAAVKELKAAGIAFTITSGRPPLGMRMLVQALELSQPMAAFNGGMIVTPSLEVLRQQFLPAGVAERVLTALESRGLDPWVYTGQQWLVRDPHAVHVAREQWTVQFSPQVVTDFSPYQNPIVKIVAVSDNAAALAAGEAEVRRLCGTAVAASRSQPYYLDITHPEANKGQVVLTLSQMLSIAPNRIATIGDGPNDILMFQKSGMSIAMGNASPEVQHAAQFVTGSNEDDGFATAMQKFVLSRAPGARRRA